MRPLSGMSPLSDEIAKWKISGEHNICGGFKLVRDESVEYNKRTKKIKPNRISESCPLIKTLAGLIVEWEVHEPLFVECTKLSYLQGCSTFV